MCLNLLLEGRQQDRTLDAAFRTVHCVATSQPILGKGILAYRTVHNSILDVVREQANDRRRRSNATRQIECDETDRVTKAIAHCIRDLPKLLNAAADELTEDEKVIAARGQELLKVLVSLDWDIRVSLLGETDEV